MNAITNIIWISAASYILFFLVSFIAWKKEIISLTVKTGSSQDLAGISIKNVAGITIFSPALILFHNKWSNLFEWPSFVSPAQILIIFFLLLIVFSIALQHAVKKNKSWRSYKKEDELTPISAIISYLAIRIVFLVIYECFFRGLLLSTCMDICNIQIAIAINLFLYASIHTFNGSTEMLTCIPFGIVLCGITIYYQSILPAIALHLVLALTHEIHLLCSPILSPKIVRS